MMRPNQPTPPPPCCDLALARALEGAEAACCFEVCQTAARQNPGKPIRAIPCAGGFALIYGPADPLNAVKGPGLEGSVDPQAWAQVEEIHRSLASPVVIDLCPLADPSFLAILAKR